MHDPVEVHPESAGTPDPEPLSGSEEIVASTEPSAISPVGFAMLSGIVGMASGMILAPWLERDIAEITTRLDWFRDLDSRLG